MPEPVLPHTDLDPHGGPDGHTYAAIDFSVNSNPFGPAPGLLTHLHHTPIHTYPDPTYERERQLAADHHGVNGVHVCFGNGTAELIHRLSRCYLNGSRHILVTTPTFGEYARAARLCGAEVCFCLPYGGETPDAPLVIDAIRTYRPTLVWLCHPNNPTGHMWQAADLEEIAKACRACDGLPVLDLAYLDFLDGPSRELAPQLPQNVVKLYSLTKSFRMPGVRLGYAVAPPDVVDALARAAPPWSVSAHAQRAAQWVFSDTGQAFLQETLPQLHALRATFQRDLSGLGLSVQDTHTNYFLLEVGDASTFKQKALSAGFRVRDGSSFGLPSKVRLAAQREGENRAFVDWLESWLPNEEAHRR